MTSHSKSLDILLVEDDPRMRVLFNEVLSQAGYRVTATGDGLHALQLLETATVPFVPYRVVVSDIRLGPVDGLQILQQARIRPNPPTVVLITGYGTLETAIAALRSGAFDYLVKPFNPTDLLACVSRAVKHQAQELRQSEAIRTISIVVDQLRTLSSVPAEIVSAPSEPEPTPIPTDRLVVVGDLSVDRYRHLATFRDAPLHLTPIEYAMLLYLAEMQGRVVSYADIVRRTHNYSVEEFEAQAMLKVHVHNLRQKLDPAYLINIRGTGYMLAVPQ
jgi:two-component system, OmpR family, response regulator